MQAKKKLISKLALGAGAVLVIAAIVALVCLRVDWSDRQRFEDSRSGRSSRGSRRPAPISPSSPGASTSSRSTRRC